MYNHDFDKINMHLSFSKISVQILFRQTHNNSKHDLNTYFD
jgi:hypothetical protein